MCCITTSGLRSFQVAFVALDGLLDAQQEGRVPLVQAGDGVKLLNLQMGGTEAGYVYSHRLKIKITTERFCSLG